MTSVYATSRLPNTVSAGLSASVQTRWPVPSRHFAADKVNSRVAFRLPPLLTSCKSHHSSGSKPASRTSRGYITASTPAFYGCINVFSENTPHTRAQGLRWKMSCLAELRSISPARLGLHFCLARPPSIGVLVSLTDAALSER